VPAGWLRPHKPAGTPVRGTPAAPPRVTRRPPMPAPMRRCRCRRRRLRPSRRRPVRATNPVQPAPSAAADTGSGLLAEERGRRPGLLPGAAGKYPDRARVRVAGDQARDLGDKGVYYRAMVGPFGSRTRRRSSAAT
jgi:hypothetical protein